MDPLAHFSANTCDHLIFFVNMTYPDADVWIKTDTIYAIKLKWLPNKGFLFVFVCLFLFLFVVVVCLFVCWVVCLFVCFLNTILPRSLVSFLYGVVWRKTTKPAVTFDVLHRKIWNFYRVCVLKYSRHSVVIWYCDMSWIKSNGTFCYIFLYPWPCKRESTWRSRVGWLAKLLRYDVTWKPSISSYPVVSFSYCVVLRKNNKTPFYFWIP